VPNDWLPWVLGVGVLLLYWVHYDRTLFQFNCVNRASALILGGDPTGGALHPDYLLAANRNVRLGNVSLVSPFFIAFGFVGPRLLYGIIGASLFLWGSRLGSTVLKRAWAGHLLGLLLALNPYVLAIPILDENLFACLATTIVLTGIAEDRVRGLWLGIVLGLLIGFRHLAVLLLPAVFWALRRRAIDKTVWRAVALPLALILGLWALHHQHTFGTVFAFESFEEYHADHAHSLLGMDFGFRGLLNWPFQDTLTRTPYNPYPTAILFPLWLLNRWGIVFLAFAPLGIWSLRQSALPGRVLAALVVPTWALLSVLGNWMQPNKMGILLVVMPAIALLVTAGLAHLVQHRLRPHGWIALGCTGALLALAQVGLARVDAPVDARVLTLEDPVRAERAEYLAWERDGLVRHNLWPDMSRVAEYSAWDPGRKWSDLWFDLTTAQGIHPAARPVPNGQNEQQTTVTLDWSAPLIGRSDWAKPTTQYVDWAPGPDRVFALPPVSWSKLHAFVAITTRPEQRTVHVFLEFDSLSLYPDWRTGPETRPIPLTQPTTTLRIPKGYLVVVTEVVADQYSRYYRWVWRTQGDVHQTDGPRTVFTN